MEAEKPIGKQEAKSLRARRALCAACVACLVRHGYGETTLNRVATEAGLSKGALQYHFPSKDALITATADYLLERPFDPDLVDPVRQETPTPTVHSLFLYSWKKFVNTEPYRGLLEILNAARTDQALRDQISGKLQSWNKAMDDQAVETYRSLTDDDEDVKVLLTMTRSFMRGLVIQDRYGSDPSENIRLVERWIDLMTPLLEVRQK
jgi:AcrR family transcriptional regulator